MSAASFSTAARVAMSCHTAHMIDTAEVITETPARRRRRRLWILAASAAVLVIALAITAFAIVRHYRDAPVLSAFGYGWLPPDNAHLRNVNAGPYSASIAAPRPGHPQTFEVDVRNDSSVTQTIVGLAFSNVGLAEPDHLAISTVDTARGDSFRVPYTSRPVSISPGGIRTLRYTHDTAAVGWKTVSCRDESWTDIYLRVRVGWFTRTEKVSLDGGVLELQAPGRGCQ